ncbi:unnamed protein product, partial [Timema podura]|nr:unnamed protein product [Timema podura]
MVGLVTGRSRLESRSGAPGRGVRAFLQPPIQGVVLQTYGSGNVPSNRKDLLAAFRDAIRRGVVIINCTQCHHGGVAPLYETGARPIIVEPLIPIGTEPFRWTWTEVHECRSGYSGTRKIQDQPAWGNLRNSPPLGPDG